MVAGAGQRDGAGLRAIIGSVAVGGGLAGGRSGQSAMTAVNLIVRDNCSGLSAAAIIRV